MQGFHGITWQQHRYTVNQRQHDRTNRRFDGKNCTILDEEKHKSNDTILVYYVGL